MPIIESFKHGKAVISSTGGALPETVGDYSPCLDPTDEDAWFELMRSWIVDQTARQSYEARIHDAFKPRSWDDAAHDVFHAIDKSLPE